MANLTSLNLTSLGSVDSFSESVCVFNDLLSSSAIFFIMLAILIVYTSALLFKNPSSLAFFIGNLVVTFVSISLFFVHPTGCERLLQGGQLAVFISLFVISGIVLLFDKTQ